MAADVKVRLSTTGLAEVVAAIRKVSTTAQTAGTTAAAGFGRFNNVLQGTRSLLVGLGLAISVAQLTSFAHNALESADSVSKMGQRVGAATESMSALSVAAERGDVDLQTFERGVGTLADRLEQLKARAPGATAAFKRLNLEAKDFRGKDSAQAFKVVSDAVSRLKDDGAKTGAVMGIFGDKIGRQLIPFMNELGTKSMPEVIAQARSMGLLLDSETVGSIQALADAGKDLGLSMRGAMTQFLAGFSPGALGTINALRGETVNAADGFRALGTEAGRLSRELLPVMNALDYIATHLRAIAVEGPAIGQALWLVANANARQAMVVEEASRRTVENLKAELKARMEARNQAYKDWRAVTAPARTPKTGPGAGEDPAAAAAAEAAANREAKVQEQLAAQIIQIEDEVAEAQGRHHDVVMRQIEAKIAKYREALIAQGKSIELANQEADAARAVLVAAEEARVIEAKLGLEKQTFEQLVAKAQASRKAGLIDEEQFQQRIAAIETARLPMLRLLAQQALDAALASGNQEAIVRANGLVQTVKELGTTSVVTGDTIKGSLQSSLTSFFATGIQQAKSFADAMVSMAQTVLSAIQSVLAQQFALSIFGGGTKAATGGKVVKKATGGIIRGPGTGISDSIPAWISNGEFIVPAAAVSRGGNLATLEAMRGGATMRPPSSNDILRMRMGGLVGSPSGARATIAGGIELRVHTDPGVEVDIESDENARKIIRVLGARPRSARKAMGID